MNKVVRDKTRLLEIVRRFAGKRVIVVGDVMLDEFVWGTVTRISPEAPVPVVQVQRRSVHLGGAANVGCNLAALGAVPMPVGVIGEDKHDSSARKILGEYRKYSRQLSGLVQEARRYSTVKTRIIAHHQQVCRTDSEDLKPFHPETKNLLLQAYARLAADADATIVSDYAKGVLSSELIRGIQRVVDHRPNGVFAVDPKVRDLRFYGQPTVLTPNKHEAELASGIAITGDDSLVKAGKKILQMTRAKNLIITRGEEGMSVFPRGGRVTHIPTTAREVYDVTGAGDTVIAVVALALACGATITEAAVIANFAAGIVVSKLGTAAATAAELVERIEREL